MRPTTEDPLLFVLEVEFRKDVPKRELGLITVTASIRGLDAAEEALSEGRKVDECEKGDKP